MDKIVVENLYKIFGPEPDQAMGMLEKGDLKDAIYEKTGLTVGVDNVSFSVAAGEIFVVMGLSGSGKSTLVRLLNRLIAPTAGRVTVDGKDVTRMARDELVKFRRHNMSMVFQSFALMPHLSVLENAAFGLALAKTDKKTRETRARQALAQVGLAGWEKAFPAELSGGMQQRVGLARGLAVDPDILLMDEAFSALDPLIRTEMQDELLALQQKHRRTIVFISHDLDEALRMGDRIAIMESGRVVQIGTPGDILRNPANAYVRAFFRGVDPTSVISAGDIVGYTHPTFINSREANLGEAIKILDKSDRRYCYVLDEQKRFLGVVSSESLREARDRGAPDDSVEQAFLDDGTTVGLHASMQEILPQVAAKSWPIPVVGPRNVFRGVVSRERFLKMLHHGENRAEQAPSKTEAAHV